MYSRNGGLTVYNRRKVPLDKRSLELVQNVEFLNISGRGERRARVLSGSHFSCNHHGLVREENWKTHARDEKRSFLRCGSRGGKVLRKFRKRCSVVSPHPRGVWNAHVKNDIKFKSSLNKKSLSRRHARGNARARAHTHPRSRIIHSSENS